MQVDLWPVSVDFLYHSLPVSGYIDSWGGSLFNGQFPISDLTPRGKIQNHCFLLSRPLSYYNITDPCLEHSLGLPFTSLHGSSFFNTSCFVFLCLCPLARGLCQCGLLLPSFLPSYLFIHQNIDQITPDPHLPSFYLLLLVFFDISRSLGLAPFLFSIYLLVHW